LRILITCPIFYPCLGGVSEVTDIVAADLAGRGHHVTVFTPTMQEDNVRRPYKVVRSSSTLSLLRLAIGADRVWVSGFNLKHVVPLLWMGRRLRITHHTYIASATNTVGPKERFKRLFLRAGRHHAVSHHLADTMNPSVQVLHPPYRPIPAAAVARTKDFVFLGRFVSDKGVPDLLAAWAIANPPSELHLYGPDMPPQTLPARVIYKGPYSPLDKTFLWRYDTAVFPSTREPFGLVAMEAAACGCHVIVRDRTGLVEACPQAERFSTVQELASLLGSTSASPPPPAMQPSMKLADWILA
jgi:glycosyltransferase involved in cell wall biosynthesis